jgi:hypothetical protein
MSQEGAGPLSPQNGPRRGARGWPMAEIEGGDVSRQAFQVDLGLQIVVRHDQRANGCPGIAATRPDGSINRSVEHESIFGGASHGYTSALSVDAAGVRQVPVPAAPAGSRIEHLAAEFLPEKVGVRRLGEAVN